VRVQKTQRHRRKESESTSRDPGGRPWSTAPGRSSVKRGAWDC
jgi:hypothetical protein